MKKNTLLITIGLFIISNGAFAQWNTPSSGTTYTMDKVGIGTQTPGSALDVRGNVYTNGSLYVDGGDIFIYRKTTPYGYLVRPNVDGYKNLAFAVENGSNLNNLLVNADLSTF